MSRAAAWLRGGTAPPEDSLLVLLSDPPAQGGAAARLVAALTGSGRRLSVVVAVARRGDATALVARLPGALVRRPRVLPGPAARLTLAALAARAVLVVGEPTAAPRPLARLARAAERRGVPLHTITQADLARIAAGGTAAMRGGRDTPEPGPLGLTATAGHLVAAMGAERGQGRTLDALAGGLARAARGPGARCVPGLRRIPDETALCRLLGGPATIMCLGNGPTAADPRLAGMARDALFRVNHRWMGGEMLARANLIFPGVKASMRAAGRVPVCVATHAKERALIAARLLAPWRGPVTYAVAEEIAGRIMPEGAGPRRPTTGAYMIAVAVALRPRRLIVAGMDMFSHPDGAYAQGAGAANAYAPAHDAGTDAAFIRACLAAHEGEILTLSPAFAAVARSVRAPRFRLGPAGAGAPGATLARRGQ